MDEELRASVRHASDPQSRAVGLKNLLRAGLVSEAALRLAAYAEDPAAALVCPGVRVSGSTEWIRGLKEWGYAALITAGSSALGVALESTTEIDELVAAAESAIRKWLSCPCDQHAQECTYAAFEANRAAVDAGSDWDRDVAMAASSLALSAGRSHSAAMPPNERVRMDVAVSDVVGELDCLKRAGLPHTTLCEAMKDAVQRFALAGVIDGQ